MSQLLVAERSVFVGAHRMVAWRARSKRYREDLPPVVCVHGAGISSRPLMPLVRSLGEQVESWAVDLPGFGRSAGPSRPLGLGELADALAGWLEELELPQVCLLGCSYGCQIASDVAVRYRERVRSLVLVGPTMDPESRTWPRALLRWLRNAAYESPRMLPLNIADYRDCGAWRMVSTFRDSLYDRVEDRLPAIEVPTLVVRGELDAMVSQPWAEEVTRLIPKARLATVPDSPHMIPFKAPDRLVPLVTDFVEEVTRATEQTGS